MVGVVYRSHTTIDNFVTDIDPIYKKLNEERKLYYVMGDFNIDLLKVDTDRPTHDYLEYIYSYSNLATISRQELLLPQQRSLTIFLQLMRTNHITDQCSNKSVK